MTKKLHIGTRVMLNDGNGMPLLGLGTGSLRGEKAYNPVLWALDAGYRHIDTAWWYGNQRQVGRAIKDSGVPRDEIFVTTKLWPSHLSFPERNLRKSLEKLQLDYVDLFLIHRQIGASEKTWIVMEKIKEMGLARSIGVSNFGEEKLKKFLDFAAVPPAINQVRCSPVNYPEKMHRLCQDKGVTMVGYSPLTRGGFDDVKGLEHEADRLGKSPAQLMLRWAIEKGIPAIPRSDTKEHIIDNADIFDFELDETATEYLGALNRL